MLDHSWIITQDKDSAWLSALHELILSDKNFHQQPISLKLIKPS